MNNLRQITIITLRKLASDIITVTIFALVLAGSSHAAQQNTIVSALLSMTGVTNQVQYLKDLVAESSKANARRCGSKPINRELPSYSAESVNFDIESALTRISSTSLEPIYRWFQSPLAAKIRIAEKSVVDYDSLRNFLQTELYKDPIRKELVQRIVANTQTLEFVATLSTEIEYAGIAHSGCIEKAAKPGKANREQMLADFTRNDKDLTAELLMSDITAETAYLFRNLTKEELTRYASYSSEDNARQFYQNLITAVQHGLKLAGDRISLAQNTDRTKFAL